MRNSDAYIHLLNDGADLQPWVARGKENVNNLEKELALALKK